MDDRRFDDLTRRLAHSVSRRTAMKGGVAAVLGAFGLRGRAAAQVTQAQCGNVTCKNNPGKCNPGCVCCVYGNGNSRCRPPGTCAPGQEVSPSTTPPPATTTTTAAPTTTTTAAPTTTSTTSTTSTTPTPGPFIESRAVESTDPTSDCFTGANYDQIVFQHGGGQLSLAARGVSSGKGTLQDPVLILYAGAGDPAPLCTPVASDDDSGCGEDPYLETELPAGTYTVAVLNVERRLGTYVFERNTFIGDSCV